MLSSCCIPRAACHCWQRSEITKTKTTVGFQSAPSSDKPHPPPAMTAQLCFATERRMPFFGLIAVLDEPRKEKGLKISGAGSLGTLPSQTNTHEEPRTVT